MSPRLLPLTADRHVPFVRIFECVGVDLTGANFHMQVRSYGDAPGSPLLDLTKVDSGDGIRLSGVSTVDGVPHSFLTLQWTDLSALPAPAIPGGDITLAYDLLVQPSGGVWQRWIYGAFTISSGETKNG